MVDTSAPTEKLIALSAPSVAPTALNWQPVIDLLAKSGTETSEFKKARAAGRAATIIWLVGLATLIATTVTNVAGSNSKAGMYAGVAVTVLGLISQVVNAIFYGSNRTDMKASAAEALTAATTMTTTITNP